MSEMASLQLQNSDVITFHSYEPPDEMKARIAVSSALRPSGCLHRNIWRGRGEAPLRRSCRCLKDEKVGAYNWGFVNGKSQTIYPWDSWEKPTPPSRRLVS